MGIGGITPAQKLKMAVEVLLQSPVKNGRITAAVMTCIWDVSDRRFAVSRLGGGCPTGHYEMGRRVGQSKSPYLQGIALALMHTLRPYEVGETARSYRPITQPSIDIRGERALVCELPTAINGQSGAPESIYLTAPLRVQFLTEIKFVTPRGEPVIVGGLDGCQPPRIQLENLSN